MHLLERLRMRWSLSLLSSSLDTRSARCACVPQACIYMLCTFWIAGLHDVPKLLFAKIATLFLFLRLAYPFFYALDLDFFRTQAWLTGLYAAIFLGCAALFPDTVLPMLGEVWVGHKK